VIHGGQLERGEVPLLLDTTIGLVFWKDPNSLYLT
jgi:hypothetical protein